MANRLSRIELNFSPAPRNPRLGSILFGIGLVAAILSGIHLRSAQIANVAQTPDRSIINGSVRPIKQDAPVRAVDPRVEKIEIAITRELQIPWARMLATLETVPVRDVALLSLEPSAARGIVRITAEAKDANSMFGYVDALRGDFFPEINLVSHELQLQTPGTPLRFVVQAAWRTP